MPLTNKLDSRFAISSPSANEVGREGRGRSAQIKSPPLRLRRASKRRYGATAADPLPALRDEGIIILEM